MTKPSRADEVMRMATLGCGALFSIAGLVLGLLASFWVPIFNQTQRQGVAQGVPQIDYRMMAAVLGICTTFLAIYLEIGIGLRKGTLWAFGLGAITGILTFGSVVGAILAIYWIRRLIDARR